MLTAAHPVPETPVMLATNAQMNRRRDMIGVSRSKLLVSVIRVRKGVESKCHIGVMAI